MNLQLVLPVFALGLLIPVNILFLYIYLRFRQPVYLSMHLITAVSLAYTGAHLCLLSFTGQGNLNGALQANRIMETAGIYYLAVFPHFLSAVLPRETRLRRINRHSLRFILGIALLLTLSAFLQPELFVSVTREAAAGKGVPGPLFVLRDVLLLVMIVYSTVLIALVFRGADGYKILNLLGFLLALYCGASAISHNFTGTYLPPLPGISFSRVALGIVFFTGFTMTSSLHRFLTQAEKVRTARNLLAQKEKRLQRQAYHDDLTDLPNQRAFFHNLEEGLCRARKNHQPLGLIITDIDDYTGIIEAFGQEKANQLLRETADRLKSRFQDQASLFRISSNAFAVIPAFPANPQQLEAMEKDILRIMNAPFLPGDPGIFITVCAGAAQYPEGGATAEDLYQNTTAALRAAQGERNSWRFFTGAMQHAAREQLDLVKALRESLLQGSFVMHYQPLLNRRGEISGAEALIRWVHPGYAGCSPALFIPLAEKAGLIVPLSRWVVEQVLQDMEAFRRAGLDLTVSINLSPRQLKDKTLGESLHRQISNIGIPPRNISFEITETELIENQEETLKTLAQLHREGYIISLDDFGTGYSSLSYLKNLPIDRLKIDKAFVEQISEEPRDHDLVQSIVEMSRRLGFTVVAEGVETEDQYQLLQELRCDYYQGFLFSPAVPREELIGLVQGKQGG